jgi:hypothetical protein
VSTAAPCTQLLQTRPGQKLTFPLAPGDVKQLSKLCSAAPYGKGKDTVVDPAIRRTLQLDPSKFTFSDASGECRWLAAIACIYGHQPLHCCTNLKDASRHYAGHGHMWCHMLWRQEIVVLVTETVPMPSFSSSQLAPQYTCSASVCPAAWQASLNTIVAEAAAGLGVAQGVTAQLYKLLLYEQGSFFLPHRDTEKVGKAYARSLRWLSVVSRTMLQG